MIILKFPMHENESITNQDNQLLDINFSFAIKPSKAQLQWFTTGQINGEQKSKKWYLLVLYITINKVIMSKNIYLQEI